MADALLSPAIGITMWSASAATIIYCSGKVRREMNDGRIPLMGVLGAFIFAAQMINFSIPVTGSSGHLGGGLILAILLGPYASFLTIASVLVVQALFFADGGLLALGCNIFNLGFFPAFIAYPLIYKRILGNKPTAAKVSAASITAAIFGLQMGSCGVVLETVFSGIAALPLPAFAAIMQPIHLAIGIVEGLVTATVVSFVYKARPEILQSALEDRPIGSHPVRDIALAFLTMAAVTGGIVSWFASEKPDGLEWSIGKLTGRQEPMGSGHGLQSTMSALQERIAVLPGYSFRRPAATGAGSALPRPARHPAQKPDTRDPVGASVSGVVGGLLTLGLAFLIGYFLRLRDKTE